MCMHLCRRREKENFQLQAAASSICNRRDLSEKFEDIVSSEYFALLLYLSVGVDVSKVCVSKINRFFDKKMILFCKNL